MHAGNVETAGLRRKPEIALCLGSSLTYIVLMDFLWQVDIDLQQHQETGLTFFAQSGHTALPDCNAHEGSEVCSAAHLQLHSEPVELYCSSSCLQSITVSYLDGR